MTPEEKQEFDALLKRVSALEDVMQKVFAITQAHQRDLDSKAKQLNVVTDFADAGRMLLQALQHVIAATPGMSEALGAHISEVYQRIEGRALFTTLSDERMEEIGAALLKSVVPEVKPFVKLTQTGEP